MTWIRGGPKCLDASNITEAIDSRSVPLLTLSQFTPYMQGHFVYHICRVKLIMLTFTISMTVSCLKVDGRQIRKKSEQ